MTGPLRRSAIGETVSNGSTVEIRRSKWVDRAKGVVPQIRMRGCVAFGEPHYSRRAQSLAFCE